MAATTAAQPLPPPQPPLADPSQRTSLYVGDLHPEVTENDLLPVFSRVGPVSSVHLCRDKLSHKSLCYAYVNFKSHSDAHTALTCLNYTELRGISMRIMWRQRDPITRKTAIGNLFVKNLNPSITSARLQEIFIKYGEILSCKVAEENGKSKGFGFVQFDSDISAMAALNAVNGTVLEGKKLYVSKFIKKSERKDTKLGFTNLYVKNLDHDLTEDQLKEKFSEYGKVCSAVIMKNEKGKSKGFGFVNFDTCEEAMNAMVALNGALIGSKNLFVGRAQKKADRVKLLRQIHGHSQYQELKTSKLYVDNLEVSVDDRLLEETFSSHGKVASANVIRGNDGVSRGCGFVRFTSSDDAVKAMHSLNGTTIHGKRMYVALVLNDAERMQTCHSKYPPQSFYTQNLDVITPEFQPLHYDFPHYYPWDNTAYQNVPIPQLNSWDPILGDLSFTAYPNFGRPFSSFYEAQNRQGNLSTHPRIFSSSGVFNQNLVGSMMDKNLSRILQNKIMNGATTKDQKPSRKLQNKSINGVAEEFSQGSATTKPVSTTSSPGVPNPDMIHVPV
ncbi:Polyadenylate-binding protein 6 [Forsythia ovata]|uniref:Polyadenylate-binding protein 6 n=1 Tax=Forsythia ovata TaxID=205694 RepID=A0ABD1TUT6_9LAMI